MLFDVMYYVLNGSSYMYMYVCLQCIAVDNDIHVIHNVLYIHDIVVGLFKTFLDGFL